jgi:tetratricopeptide (TPR) repeat protein
MGVVFKAQDTGLGRVVALKLLSPELFQNETARTRFLREAQLAATISHPNVATVYEVSEEDGAPFIAMEFVPGSNLKDRILRGPLDFDEVLSVGCQVCDALTAAHLHGIVHRDIKSSNIMITPEGQAKVLDFGLAKALSDSMLGAGTVGDATPLKATRGSPGSPAEGSPQGSHQTMTGAALGTPTYMSPEQANGLPVDVRSDIFSLGVVLYETASGQLPFQGRSEKQILEAIRNQRPLPVHALRREIPRSFSRVLDRCLAKRTDERYPSAAALRLDLNSLRKGSPVGKRIRNLVGGWRSRARSRTAVVGRIALLAVLAAVGLLGYNVVKNEPAKIFQANVPRWVMVYGFENRTGDDDFDTTIEDVIGASLDQSPQIKAVGRERMHRLLDEMGIGDRARSADRTLLQEACLRGGIPVLVTGQIALLGSQLVVTARVWSVADDEEIAIVRETAESKAQLLSALDRLATSIRERAGESLPGLKALQRPAELWTSSSWDALRMYSEAVGRHLAQDHLGAIALLRRAVSLDPEFAMAYGRLARIYNTMSDTPDAQEAFGQALKRLDRLTFKERGLIVSEHHLATGRYAGAVEELRSLTASYPMDPDIHESLSYALSLVSDYGGALESIDRAIELAPSTHPGYLYERANLLLFSGDLESAAEQIALNARHISEPAALGFNRGYLALLGGEVDRAAGAFEEMGRSGNPYLRARSFVHKVKVHALAGRFRRAEAELENMVRLAQGENLPASAAHAHLLGARLALGRGSSAEVHRLTLRALELPLDAFGIAAAGGLLARAGYPEEATRTLDRLASEVGEENPSLERLVLQLQGEIALVRGDSDAALSLMERAASLTPAPQWSEPLARTLLASGDRDRALAEYERIVESKAPLFILDHGTGGEIIGTVTYIEAVYRLGEIHLADGNEVEAQRFHDLYAEIRREADDDLPEPIALRHSFDKANPE